MTRAAEPPLLILASASPRRTALLAEWGLAHLILPSDFVETIDPAAEVGRLTEMLAEKKAADVVRRLAAADDPRLRTAVCLAADTLVSLDGVHLGKPANAADAGRMLRSLSGRDVSVATGVAVASVETGTIDTMHADSLVIMRRFSDEEIAEYVATGEPLDKAGAFAVQGLGRRLIAEVRGSLSNVIGLPKEIVLPLLDRYGIRPSHV